MARSTRDTLIFATILLAPFAVATAYIAFGVGAGPAPQPQIVVLAPASDAFDAVTPEPVVAPEPTPAPSVAEPEPTPVAEPEPEPEPDAEPAPALPVNPGAAMLMYDHQLVVASDPDIGWATGPLKVHTVLGGEAVSKAVDRSLLPPVLAELYDARVVVYAEDGSTCTSTVGAMSIYGREDGDVYFDSLIDNYDDDGDPNPSLAELLRTRQRIFKEAQVLRAKLTTRGCDGVWARRADLPAPALFAEVKATADPDPLFAEVLKVVQRVPEVANLRANYQIYREDTANHNPDDPPGSWTEWLQQNITVQRFDEVGGPRSFVNVVIGNGGEPCTSEDFYDRVAVMFSRQGERLKALEDPGFFGPAMLMDIDGDGHLEAITEAGRRLESRSSLAANLERAYDFPFIGCSC